MSEGTHKDASQGWLIFFFICFAITVLSIGVFAMFTYNANPPEPTVVKSGGH